jgi:hypothetical protein
MSINERLAHLPSPTFRDLMSLFEVARHPLDPRDYLSDRNDWSALLNTRSRDDGGLHFAQYQRPVIDVAYARTFKPIMMSGSEYDTDAAGIATTDFHLCFSDTLFNQLSNVYPSMNHASNLHLSRDQYNHILARVDVLELIPLSLSQHTDNEPSAYYVYLSMESYVFGEEEFAVFVFNDTHREELLAILNQRSWIRRTI